MLNSSHVLASGGVLAEDEQFDGDDGGVGELVCVLGVHRVVLQHELVVILQEKVKQITIQPIFAHRSNICCPRD